MRFCTLVLSYACDSSTHPACGDGCCCHLAALCPAGLSLREGRSAAAPPVVLHSGCQAAECVAHEATDPLMRPDVIAVSAAHSSMLPLASAGSSMSALVCCCPLIDPDWVITQSLSSIVAWVCLSAWCSSTTPHTWVLYVPHVVSVVSGSAENARDALCCDPSGVANNENARDALCWDPSGVATNENARDALCCDPSGVANNENARDALCRDSSGVANNKRR